LILDDFGRVASAAVQSIEKLLAEWLPLGVKDGAEYCIGSKHGEAGKSMRIRLHGERAGSWADFSYGVEDSSDAGGDLISLYAYINNVSQGKACAAIAKQLGMTLADDDNWKNRPRQNAPIKQPPAAQVLPPAPADSQAPVEKKPRSLWEPLLPVPDIAGPFPVAHPVRGKPAMVWQYRDQEGRLLGIIARFVTSDGGKEVIPCVYAKHAETGACKWHWISFRDPRPLYLHGALRPELPVLVVEGEKCADAAYDMLWQWFDVVSWPGGGKAVPKADWSPLAGRTVILWADADAKPFKDGHAAAGEIMPEADQPGMKAMVKLADILAELGCTVQFIDIPAPGVKPDGWDIADLIADGATQDDVHAWTAKLRAGAQADAPEMSGPAPDLPPAPADDGIPDWVTYTDEGSSTPATAGAMALGWQELRAMMLPNSSGGVKACRENVYMALKHDAKLQGIVAMDTFAELLIKRRKLPWQSEPGEWTEGDDFHLGMYVAKRYGLTMASIGEIEKAVSQIAREHSFNPVIDYMNACADKWDGVPRVEAAFTTYWGAPDTEYIRLVSTMFLVGMAARAFYPGVKHDCAPVFEGGQGKGKSTALSVLAGDWYADTPFRMGEKDGYLSIQGILLYEVAELEQFNRSEVTAVKAFMSSRIDRYREPYGRRMKNMPRRTLFAATTNEGQYFKDPSGNRRFWPVEVGRIDIDALTRDRDQLFGEAVHLQRSRVQWYPTQEQQIRLINPQQEDREIPDPWIGRLYDYCEGLSDDGKPIFGNSLDKVTVRELLTKALHIEIGKLGPAKQETMRISTCMRKLGWVKDRQPSGAREYFYMRPAKIAPAVPVEEDADALPI
jgi:putative DNA primase/helicase